MNTNPPTPPISIEEHKNRIFAAAEERSKKEAEVKTLEANLIAVAGNFDERTLAATNPKALAAKHAEIAMAQSRLSVARLVLDAMPDAAAESCLQVLADSKRMRDRIVRLNTDNLARIRAHVLKVLRGTKLYEEARLPRFTEEAQPVRNELLFQGEFLNLNVGGGQPFYTPCGTDYYISPKPQSVLAAHDKLASQLERVEEHTAGLRNLIGG